jgi:hypothetical protein
MAAGRALSSGLLSSALGRLPFDGIGEYRKDASKQGVRAKQRLRPSALCSKAFCDLTESARIAKTRRNKELEQGSVYA